ncbi:MAG: alpha-1,2-fucosyltransferase [Candidatus Eisenbacteria bacterium]|uniref:Alpha-1,2-fucosyltransferase n=1 Tax=Eiseniibacteriota bacterium TaxID=2212470 RepID=A0A538U8M5_UNCEI|nr:MAG: alpha-1,2-fucosyltransferase [Candidatus Eisenbacteria bacterium]
MITARLMGGLGNQLFQYAAGFALARRLGVPLQLDATWFRGVTGRRYALEPFTLSGRVASDSELRAAGIRHPSAWARGLARVGIRKPAAIRGHAREPGFSYWDGFLSLGDGAYLDGYWQSERYFAEVAQVARAEFALRRPPDAENQRMLDAIRGAEAVGIHARRGDYVTDARTRDVHGHAPAEYYAAAVARIRSLVRAPAFFVFSDDPAWAAQHLRVDPATVIVGHNDAGRDYEDLRLMSACRHHIIANSTFSWWAAWLGERPGQRVIAPRHWFRDGPDARDLVPARWERR